MSVKEQSLSVLGLVGWLVLCFMAAGVGAVASAGAQDFYALLQQPAWAPPGYLFGPVWTVLYAMMAVSAWLVWRKRSRPGAIASLGLFIIQLLFNTAWSWLFFAWKLGGWAFLDVLLLWVLIALTIYRFVFISRWAALLLVPYWLWVTFAAVLNFVVWQLNPQNL